MNYKHFIITRFNLRSAEKEWSRDKQGNSVFTDEWINHRTDLFLKYCLPSVVNQTNKNFLWLLYFDITTNDNIQKKFRDLENEHKYLLKVIYVNGYEDFQKSYCNDVLSLCNTDQKYIITTRLDNDDIIHKDFIKKIQDNFFEQEFMAVNFVKILMINPYEKNKIHIDYSFSNHFISLIEKINHEGISGCYNKGDRFWNQKYRIIQINDKPYCIEIISERNVLNNFRGFPVFRKVDLSDFQIKDLMIRNSFFDRYNFKLYKMSWRKLLINLKISFIRNIRK
ncbi:MAG: hypothetical protein QG611_1115 [Bacteroidota bacterium]|nr:hypothetical protein [Bacteroidota bacterium]